MNDKWGKTVFSSRTTFRETEKGADDFNKAGSLFHGRSALPVYIIEKYICGVTPEYIRGETTKLRPVMQSVGHIPSGAFAHCTAVGGHTVGRLGSLCA